MSEKKNIDFQTKKTEAGWIDATDRFWLAATPRLFEWLRMVVVLAAASYVARKSDSSALKILVGLCYVSMLFYFQAFFYQFEFHGLPWVKSQVVRHLLSLTISVLLAMIAYLVVRVSVDALVQAHP